MNEHTINSLRSGVVVALAGVALMAGSCGESDDESSAAARPAERPRQFDLEPFLMRNGEQPGVRRVESVLTEDAETFAVKAGLRKAELSRMRSAGMGPATYQPTEGRNSRGVTSVTLFASAKGAASWMALEQSRSYIRRQLPGGGKLRYFDVAGIPGARGWTASKGDHKVGNVYWVQGRCLMILGTEGPGPIAGPLSTGAQAIYDRTEGQCCP